MIRRTRLWRDRWGAAGVMFTLVLVPLFGMLALAIDYGAATVAKSQLELAADSAALKAITAASAARAANPGSNYLTVGQTAGAAFFQAQLGTIVFGTATAPTVTLTESNGKISAAVTAQAVLPTFFAQVLGFSRIGITGASAATLTEPLYVAVQVLVDTSASMGILTDTTKAPATLYADIQARIKAVYGGTAPAAGSLLVSTAALNSIITLNNYQITNKPPPSAPCAFACHYDTSTSGPDGQSNDFYGIAEANGLQMRIDVLRDAVRLMINQVQSSLDAGYFQFGIYGFSKSLTTIFPMSADLSAAYAAAANINVSATTPYCAWAGAGAGSPPLCGKPSTAANGPNGDFRDGQVPQTSFETAANALIASTLTPTPTSNGASAQTPMRYLFLITDGVDDYTTNKALNFYCCNQLIYPINTTDGTDGTAAVAGSTACDRIKAAGVTILVLYTPYSPIVSASYTAQVEPIVTPLVSSQVTAALQACASSSEDFFQANSTGDIQAAIYKMLAIVSGNVGTLTK
jgi:Flp pilus assembly protein TadG